MTGGRTMGSGQDTDTAGTIQDLATRIEMVEGVNRALEDEYRRIRRDLMYLENVVANMWRATMGPIPTTPDTPEDPPATPAPDPTPRPRPPVPTPPPPPKPPSVAKNRVSDAINSFKNRFRW